MTRAGPAKVVKAAIAFGKLMPDRTNQQAATAIQNAINANA